MKSETDSLHVELKTKIQCLHEALEECNQIVNSLKKENERLQNICQSIEFKNEGYPDLSKIKGDQFRMIKKQLRIRCSDEKFLEAVFNSKNYAEIAEKTGQKIATTIARYSRTRAKLSKKGIELPTMERKKQSRKINNLDKMTKIVNKLKEIYYG